MEQLPLAITRAPEPSFENFVAGPNAEALGAVRALAAGTLAEPLVYLWGEAGCGRTHLLEAAARAAVAARGLTTVDDVHALDTAAQALLFTRINQAREGHGVLLAAGDAPPARLALREDLRSRLGWGLVYQLRPASDADKATHLHAEAARRGMRVADEVVEYLLTRLPRDLGSLNAAIERLDRYSLSRRRHVTLALAREALSPENDAAPRT